MDILGYRPDHSGLPYFVVLATLPYFLGQAPENSFWVVLLCCKTIRHFTPLLHVQPHSTSCKPEQQEEQRYIYSVLGLPTHPIHTFLAPSIDHTC